MQIPRIVWNRRHNVAAIHVSFAPRVWETRDLGDVLLGYNAAGRLAKIVLLDPGSLLPPGADERQALEATIALLLRRAQLRQPDLEVLRSALDRIPASPRVDGIHRTRA